MGSCKSTLTVRFDLEQYAASHMLCQVKLQYRIAPYRTGSKESYHEQSTTLRWKCLETSTQGDEQSSWTRLLEARLNFAGKRAVAWRENILCLCRCTERSEEQDQA